MYLSSGLSKRLGRRMMKLRALEARAKIYHSRSEILTPLPPSTSSISLTITGCAVRRRHHQVLWRCRDDPLACRARGSARGAAGAETVKHGDGDIARRKSNPLLIGSGESHCGPDTTFLSCEFYNILCGRGRGCSQSVLCSS